MEEQTQTKERSLREDLAEISAKLDEVVKNKKAKAWKIPWTKRNISKKKKRDGYVLFQNIGHNKAVTFIKAPIEEGVAMVNGVPHTISPEDILYYKNKLPLVIQPQWSENPFSAKDHFDKTNAAGQNTMGWEYIMNFIYKTQIKAKKQIGMGLIIIGIAAVVGLGYYLIKSGAFS